MANEKRLVDADALMGEFRSYMVERYDREKCVSEENCKNCESSCLWRKIVSAAPTVDAVEVVHGRWIWWKRNATTYDLMCSVCKRKDGAHEDYNYCPNCGAKMDGGIEDGKRYSV